MLAHVGDCRAYRVTSDAAIALTADHTLPGSPAIKTRMIGMAELDPEIRAVRLFAGERLLLCTNGLHGAVDDSAIAELARLGSIERAADALIERAILTSRDNVAIAILDPRGTPHVSCRNGSVYPYQ